MNDRSIIDVVVAGIDPNDYPDFCDAYIESATWEDTGEPLTEEEIEQNFGSDEIDALIQEQLY